jgi:hypothetical protein
MISKSELFNLLPENCNYNEQEDIVYLNGIKVISGNDLYEKYLLENGLSFSSIYDNHAFLINLLSCNKCRTVIFEEYNNNWEENFRCPICTDYKTSYDYYSLEDIEQNKNNIQDTINSYKSLKIIEEEMYKKYIKRGNKHEWEITKKYTIKLKRKNICFQLIKYKYLKMEIYISKKDNYIENVYTIISSFKIPLTIFGIYDFIKDKIKNRLKTSI